jgi:hypothetical protein
VNGRASEPTGNHLTTMIDTTINQKEGDPRVAAALQALDINFKIDEDGDYEFGFQVSETRTQLGFIRSKTYDFGGMERRDVLSIGLKSFGPFDPRTMNLLLEQNAKVQVGAWCTIRDADDNHLAIFKAGISADLEGELLLDIVSMVLLSADYVEERLSGRDDF